MPKNPKTKEKLLKSLVGQGVDAGWPTHMARNHQDGYPY